MDYHDISIGDQVRIRQWDDMAEEFGLSRRDGYPSHIHVSSLTSFVREMRDLCGKTATVVGVDGDRVQLLFSAETRARYRTRWTYTAGMLEHAEALATVRFRPEDLSSILFAAAR